MLVTTARLKYFIAVCGTTNAPLQKNDYIIWDSLPDQRNAIKDDYISMKNQLQSIKDQLRSPPESMSETDLDEVSHTIEQLEAFQKLIQKGIQDRIFKMKRQESHIKGIEMIGIRENGPLNKKAKIDSPSSETTLTRDLCLDLVEEISQRVWDGRVDELSGILNGLPLLRDNDQRIKKEEQNGLFLRFQHILFQQVSYMYKQKMISKEAFRKFSQSKITLEIAAFNMIRISPHSDVFRYLSPASIFINEWTSECYRNIYKGEYEERILINTCFP